MEKRMSDEAFERTASAMLMGGPEKAMEAEARRARESEKAALDALERLLKAAERAGGPQFGEKGRDRDVPDLVYAALRNAGRR